MNDEGKESAVMPAVEQLCQIAGIGMDKINVSDLTFGETLLGHTDLLF